MSKHRKKGGASDLIRQGVLQSDREQILLADAEREFAEQSRDGLPGENLFYEHIHLNFDGNYLLARIIGAQIEKLLPAWVTKSSDTNHAWPSAADCAKRLGWSDLNKLDVCNDILTRVSAAPFTGQLNHNAQMLRLQASLKKLVPANQPAALKEAQKVCEAEVALFPDDPMLNGQLASLKSKNGDLAGATASLRRELELLPSDSTHWFQLGVILAQQQQFEGAVAAFQRGQKLDPGDVLSVNNQAQSLWMLGRREEAIREFRRMTVIQPESGLAWINLGECLEQTGQKTAAEDCYHKALMEGGKNKSELLMLAHFCQNRGWRDAAVANYNKATRLEPLDANLRVEVGQNLLVLDQYGDAAHELAEAVRLAPESAEAHYFYGLAVGQQGNTTEAEAQFREALRIQPDLLETRVNLGAALMKEGHAAEALTQFEEVLQQCPTNKLALEYSRTLRSQFAPPPAR